MSCREHFLRSEEVTSSFGQIVNWYKTKYFLQAEDREDELKDNSKYNTAFILAAIPANMS